MPDGPTLPEPVRADGTYCRVIASSTGRAYLSLGRDHAEAEIVSVDIGWSQITLRGRLVNSPAEACSGDVELIRRNGKVSRTLPATWQGTSSPAPCTRPTSAPPVPRSRSGTYGCAGRAAGR